jgi:hypothetical protein
MFFFCRSSSYCRSEAYSATAAVTGDGGEGRQPAFTDLSR